MTSIWDQKKYPRDYYYNFIFVIIYLSYLGTLGIWVLLVSLGKCDFWFFVSLIILAIVIGLSYLFRKRMIQEKKQYDALLKAGYPKEILLNIIEIRSNLLEIRSNLKVIKKQYPINYRDYIEKLLLELEENGGEV